MSYATKLLMQSLVICVATLWSVGCTDSESARESTDESAVTGAVKPDATNPCARVSSANDGLYCGGSLQNGFTGGPSNELFTCSSQLVAGVTTCGSSCSIGAAGTDDRCNPDPCAGVSAANNGSYCGRTTQAGFNPQNASFSAVYVCVNGKSSQIRFCENGCIIAQAGKPDSCNTRTM